MGEHNISTGHDARQAQAFMKSLLADVAALERWRYTPKPEPGSSSETA